jgi:type IV pilus assembly protein PilV
MSQRMHFNASHRQSGTTMIEVLVSIIIVVIGLLGLAGLQARINLAEMEAFQRAQAIVLLEDMVDRLNANHRNPMSYVTAAPMGAGQAVQVCSAMTGATRDLCEWSNALLGAGESSGGLQVGAMIGARGCVTNTVATRPRQFLVSVVWQGNNPTTAPAATACGSGDYGNEALRRAVVTTVIIACQQNNPLTGVCTVGG